MNHQGWESSIYFFTHEICNHSLLKVFLYWCSHAPEGLSCSCLHIKKLAAFLFPRIMIVNNVRKPYGANTAVVKPISSSPWHLRDYAIFSSAFADSPKKSADLLHPRQANQGVIWRSDKIKFLAVIWSEMEVLQQQSYRVIWHFVYAFGVW